MYPTNLVQKWCRDQDNWGLLLAITQRVKELKTMSDGEVKADTRHNCDDEQQLEKEIDKEKQKLKYFLDETDKLIKLRDYTETDIANRRVEKIVGKLSDLISQAEEMKIDHDVQCICSISETMEEGREGHVYHYFLWRKKSLQSS